MASSTITVRASRAVAGLKAGEIGEVENDDYIKAAIEAGHLVKLTKAEAKELGAEHLET